MSFGKKPAKPDNKRATGRVQANISAAIILPTGERIRCHVENFSKTGALLSVESVLGLPSEFELDAGNGLRRRVEVMRRGSKRLGVRFI
jgi:hypothetical protein